MEERKDECENRDQSWSQKKNPPSSNGLAACGADTNNCIPTCRSRMFEQEHDVSINPADLRKNGKHAVEKF